MDAVVTEKAVELVETKAEEIGDKAGKVVDDELGKVEEKVNDLLKTFEGRLKEVEAVKKVENIVDKLDDNPAVKKVMDEVADSVIEQVDGRAFSCGCFGWNLSLRISRKKTQSSPTKPLASSPPLSESKLSSEQPPHEESSA